MHLRKNNIVILGMTGVGKTTIGKILSKILKFKFIDVDYKIEKASNLKVSDFLKNMEKKNLELEKKIFLKSLQSKENTIISSGSRILSDEEIILEMKKKSISIFLDINTSNLVNRLKYNIRNRPKLQRGNLKKNLENMYKNRITNYNQADIKISVNELPAGDVVSRIIKKLNYEKFNKFNVKLKDSSYPIFIGKNLISNIKSFIPKFEDYSKIIVVTDKIVLKNLSQAYKNIQNLSKKKFLGVTLPSGEKTKSFQHLQFLCENILKEKIDRNALIICLGGGVVGDIVGLTANLLLRGIDFIQIPTTLLAQVDSSVGGKTAINSKYGKNLIGSFNQPKAVIISIETLKKLKRRQIISGYAEILKYS